MTPAGTRYAIRIDDAVHTLRVFRETAIEAARLLQQRNTFRFTQPGAAGVYASVYRVPS